MKINTPHKDESYAVWEHGQWDEPHGNDKYRQQTGRIVLKQGAVEATVYQEENFQRSRLEFIYKGRQYLRTWSRAFGNRTMVTLAKQFVKDVVSHE